MVSETKQFKAALNDNEADKEINQWLKVYQQKGIETKIIGYTANNNWIFITINIGNT